MEQSIAALLVEGEVDCETRDQRCLQKQPRSALHVEFERKERSFGDVEKRRMRWPPLSALRSRWQAPALVTGAFRGYTVQD